MPALARPRIDRLEPRMHFAAGDPSNDFGTDGYRRFSKEYGRIVFAIDLFPTRDNGLLAGVYGENRDLRSRPVGTRALARLLPGGALDPAFGREGKIDLGMRVLAVAERSDGKFLVLARDSTNGEARLVRLKRFGAIDRGFGSRGSVTLSAGLKITDFGNETDVGAGRLHLSIDGVVTAVVPLRDRNGFQTGSVIRRWTPAGTLDASFGTNGEIALQSRRYTLVPRYPDALLVEPDGSIFLNATRVVRPRARNVVVKFTPTGQFDPTFAGGGVLYPDDGENGVGATRLRDSLLITATRDRVNRLLGFRRVDFDGRTINAIDFRGGETFGVVAGAGGVVELPGGQFLAGGRRYNADGTFDASYGYVTAGNTLSAAGDRLYGKYDRGIMSIDLVGNRSRPVFALDNGRLTITGTAGADRIQFSTSGPRLNDNDVTQVWAGASRDGVSRNFLTADIREVVINGGAGDDIIFSGAYFIGIPSTLSGDAGDDDITGGNFNTGGRGSIVFGGEGNDTLSGGDNAVVDGGAGDDRISGGGGIQIPFNGAATLRGGAGNDCFNVEGAARVEAGDGSDTVYAAGGGQDPGYRPTVYGGAGDDMLFGYPQYTPVGYNNPIGKLLFGEAGDDTLDAGDGPDSLDGGPGRDVLRGGRGEDTLVSDDSDVVINR